MCPKNQTMLEDIVILTNMIKDALEIETLDTIIELYDYYRLLDKAIKATKRFTNGYFLIDINEAVFQETESFLSPEMKWAYFTQEQLKKFNDAIIKFIRQSWMIGFTFNSNMKKILTYYLGKYTCFIPFKEHDNKFTFSDTCKEIVYEYLNLTNDVSNLHKSFCSTSDLHTTKIFYIETTEQKNILIDDIKKNLEKLEDFKLYLEYYFLKNDIPKSMFITKQTFSHHYSYEY